jgi:DNA-binding transcriptional LysR family regulator
MFDLKDLRCFVAVYESHGFARAASELHTVQSAVSTRILRLEAVVGASLFLRMHRGIVPTAKGDLLYRHAKRVFAELEDLETSVKMRQAG